MRSRADLAALCAALVMSAPALFAADDAARPAVAAQPARAPTEAEIHAAVAKLKADPNLADERSIRTLEWKNPKEKEDKPREMPAWLKGFVEMLGWLAGSSRVLVWVLLAALIAVLILVVVRIILAGRGGPALARFVAPTHVQDLDIRPESLPPDIGAAARALWDGGDQRAALALLYRGMVSRLAHVFEVPIRASSTEGDCIALAARKLDAERLDYATRLVRTWQRAIYGGIPADTADVYALCVNFATHLDPPPATARTDRLAEAS